MHLSVVSRHLKPFPGTRTEVVLRTRRWREVSGGSGGGGGGGGINSSQREHTKTGPRHQQAQIPLPMARHSIRGT